jgi:epoxyqueuosine reductase
VREENLSQRIKHRARHLGFDLVGIAPVEPSGYADFYQRWLAQDYAGEMGYLSRPDAVAKRCDPRLIVPEARSAVVVAMSYYQGSPPSTQTSHDEKRGRVARYAWGDDYHEIMWKRLDRLLEFVQSQADRPVSGRRYVDTGPILERELAVRAGLGWFGKNTMLINPRLGSWLLLGELLLDLDLEADPPFVPDHCGTCTRCIDVCPTQCILPDRTLDASRCISYLTIELKSPDIPDALRPFIGEWVFGCDVCQEVCPWNRFASATQEPAFQPRPGVPRLDLAELLTMDEETFRHRFQDSPLRRAKRQGLQRNAAVVLEHMNDDGA